MRKIRGIRQHDRSDCGAACLQSIAGAFGYNDSISRIRQLAGTGKNGTSVRGLMDAAEKMGFLVKALKADPEQITSAPVPSIAHVEIKKNMQHFVVILSVTRKQVRYMDPGEGRIRKVNVNRFREWWTGVLLIMAPGPDFSKNKGNPSTAWRFLKLARPFRKTLIQAIAGAVIFSVLGLSTSIFVQKIVDFVLVNQNLNLLNLMSCAMIVLLIARILISWFKSILLLKTGHQVDAGIIMGYFQHLLELPQQFFDSMRVGEILSRVSDAVKIRVFINHSLIETVVSVLTIIITLLVMSLISFRISLLVIAAIPVYLLIYLCMDRINKVLLRKLMEESAGFESQLVEVIRTQKTIRVFGWKEWVADTTSGKLAGLLGTNYKAGMTSVFTGHVGEAVGGFLTITLLWTGAGFILRGDLSPGELMSLYAMLGYLLGPVKSLGNLGKIFRDAMIAADRLFSILDLEGEKNTGSGMITGKIKQDIVFEGVSFRYASRPLLFRNLSFTIPVGRQCGIVGRSGCGKSSLAALLMAEYLPEKGNIKVNDLVLNQLNISELRNKTGIVPQQIELFSGSILDNLLPKNLGTDSQRVMEISSRTGLLEFVRTLPSGFHTELAEGGVGLSGGEKQRIALTRALLNDPEILIIDEATSGLDSDSESRVLQYLKELVNEGLTLIHITHKLDLIKEADQIILIENGTVEESGNHKNLLRNNGKYRELWDNQNPH